MKFLLGAALALSLHVANADEPKCPMCPLAEQTAHSVENAIKVDIYDCAPKVVAVVVICAEDQLMEGLISKYEAPDRTLIIRGVQCHNL